MLPSFGVCLALTAVLIAAGWWLYREYDQGPALVRHECYAVAAAIWIGQLTRWIYRLVGYNYRLTTRRLFWGQGFLYPLPAPVELADIRAVTVQQSWLESRLGVGRISIAGKEPQLVVLQGVRQPERIAAQIERTRALLTGLLRIGDRP
jgi:hypothetical protein